MLSFLQSLQFAIASTACFLDSPGHSYPRFLSPPITLLPLPSRFSSFRIFRPASRHSLNLNSSFPQKKKKKKKNNKKYSLMASLPLFQSVVECSIDRRGRTSTSTGRSSGVSSMRGYSIFGDDTGISFRLQLRKQSDLQMIR